MAVISFTGNAFAQNSEWDSNYKRIYLSKNGKNISGTYDYAGGKITAIIEGKVLKGWWSETDDSRNCGPNKQWSGPFIFKFSSDGKSFTGQYGKCSNGQKDFNSLDGDWHGHLVSGSPIVNNTQQPDVITTPKKQVNSSKKNSYSHDGFEQRHGPFSNGEDTVGDFSENVKNTKGIVILRPSGRATASGQMSPGDIDMVLFGHAIDGPVSVSLYPCSKEALLRLLDLQGNEIASSDKVTYGYSGYSSSVSMPTLKRGAYAVEVSYTGITPCENTGWYISVSARITDPKEFVSPKEIEEDFSTREDLNVDGLINDIKIIMRSDPSSVPGKRSNP